MTTIQCPRCGYVFRPAEYAIMSEAERLVLETLRGLRKSPFTPVSTRMIADFTGYSPRWARAHLTNLCRNGVVCLPHGRHSGWVEVYAAEMSNHMMAHSYTMAVA